MTFVALVAIIALAAGGLIVVMLAIARVERIHDVSPLVSSARARVSPVTIETGGAMPAPSDAPSPRETADAATARAQKPPRRSAWHGITQARTSWRHPHADDLVYPRARRRRWAIDKGRVGGPAAFLAFLVVLGYLLAHI